MYMYRIGIQPYDYSLYEISYIGFVHQDKFSKAELESIVAECVAYACEIKNIENSLNSTYMLPSSSIGDIILSNDNFLTAMKNHGFKCLEYHAELHVNEHDTILDSDAKDSNFISKINESIDNPLKLCSSDPDIPVRAAQVALMIDNYILEKWKIEKVDRDFVFLVLKAIEKSDTLTTQLLWEVSNKIGLTLEEVREAFRAFAKTMIGSDKVGDSKESAATVRDFLCELSRQSRISMRDTRR